MSQRAFRSLFDGYTQVVRAAVKRAAQDRRVLQWERYVDWLKLTGMMKTKATELYGSVQERGAGKARAASRRVRKAADDGIFFDEAHPYAVDWAATRSSEFVTLIDDSVRNALREYVAGAIRDGTPIDALARQLEGVVGLRPDQVSALERIRAQLAEEGRAQSEIDRLIVAKAQRMVAQRATTIARTETAAAQNHGALGEWAQQVASGDLPQDAEREWIAGQEGECAICKSLDGKRAAMAGRFHSDHSGQDYLMPPAHVNCRCSQGVVVP